MGSVTLPREIAVCPEPVATNWSYSQEVHDQMGSYYNFSARLMRFVINTVSDDTILRIAEMIKDPQQTSPFVMEDVFRNGYILFVVIVSLTISFLLIVSCIFAVICGAFTSGREIPGQRSICCAMLSFMFCLSMAALGMFLLTASVSHIKHGLAIWPVQVNKSSEDISTFVAGFGANLRCNFEGGEKLLRFEIKMYISHTTEILNEFRKTINPIPMIKALEYEEKCRRNLNTMVALLKRRNAPSSELEALTQATDNLLKIFNTKMELTRDRLHDTRDRLVLLGKDLNTSISQMDTQQTAILSELSLYKTVLEDLVKAVDRHSEKLQTILYEVMRRNDYVEKTSQFIPVVLVLPLILLALSALGIIFLIFRSSVGNIGSKTSEVELSIRNKISHMGGRILSCGGYTALIVTSLLFLMVALCFVIAFASMFMCMGLFEDHDLRLLQALPQKIFEKDIGKGNVQVNIYDTFYKCKNDFSFFDAIEGDKIWARKQIGKKLSSLRRHSFRRRLRNFYVDDEVIAEIKDALKQLSEVQHNFINALSALSALSTGDDIGSLGMQIFSDFVHLHVALMASARMLENLNSRSRRDKISMDIHNHLKQVEEAIINAVAWLLRTMHDLTPQCGPIMAIWDDIGFYMCNIIAVPTQGLWVACLLTAIGAFSIFLAICKATAFLLSYEMEKADTVCRKPNKIFDYPLDKTQYEEYEESMKTEQQAPAPTKVDSHSTEPAKLTLTPRIRRGKIEWVLVDHVLHQLFGVPSGVKFMPVVVSGDLEKGSDKAQMPQRTGSRTPIVGVAWSQNGASIASESWQVARNGKIQQMPSTLSAERKDDREEVPVEITESKDGKEKTAKEGGTSEVPESVDRTREERPGEVDRQQEGKRSKKRKSLMSLRDIFTFKKRAKEKSRSKITQKLSFISAYKGHQRAKPDKPKAIDEAPGGVKKRSPRRRKEHDPSRTYSRSDKVERKDESPKESGKVERKDGSPKEVENTPKKDDKTHKRLSSEAIHPEDAQKVVDKVDSKYGKESDRHAKPARSPSSSKRHLKKTQHSKEYNKEDSSSRSKSKSKESTKKVKGADEKDDKKDADKGADHPPPSPSERKHSMISRTYVTADESLKEKKHQK
ncbi:hypothetical protein Y032_0103g3554 [Ancylostoma ceylanicum]|nr:hypothetical protein Y032_0103g3554 [Ancylostoma ceylanicum]